MFVMLLSDSAAQNVFHDDRSPSSAFLSSHAVCMADCGRRLTFFGEHTMRKLSLAFAVLALTSAAGAYAEVPYPAEQPFVSSVSRAEVKQELIQAEQQGQIADGDNYPVAMPASSHLSRQDVRQDLQHAHNMHDDATYAGA